MSREELSQLKHEVINKKRELLKKRVSAIERKMLNDIFDKLIKELEVSNGKIVRNGKNIEVSTAIDTIFKAFEKNEYIQVLRVFTKDLADIQGLNKRYFEILENDRKKIAQIDREAKSALRTKLGINAKGEVQKNGYLDRLVTDDAFKKKVKRAAYKAVLSGGSLDQFKKKIEKIVVGSPEVNGGLQQHFNTFAYDTYQYTDRYTSKLYAKKLGLKAFIYNGGKIKTTRPFCRERDGKVFTTEEALKWKDSEFQGKPENYDPLTDCGGYNCRHSIDFIAKSEAIRRRPELEGKL